MKVSEMKPAAVETVVRIIGMPTCRNAERTRSTGSDVSSTTSWKCATKCSPSADPITITKIGTITVTTSISSPRPNIKPNVQIAPSSAGIKASTLRRRSPIVAKKVPISSKMTIGGITSRKKDRISIT